MKKLLAVIFSLAVLAGCSANESTEVSETTATDTSSAVTSESTAVTTAASAATITTTTTTTAASTVIISFTEDEEKPPINAELGVNGDGTLNDTFTKRIEQLMEPHLKMAMDSVFPTLWDFDEDGVPEIILIFHSGSQGSMPCMVYSAETLEEIGEFNGFCRDGFTRFINRYDGNTVIYSYYEHSNWQRVETIEFVRIVGKKLVSGKKILRNWQTGETVNPAMVVYSDHSDEMSYDEKDFLDYNFGTVCTSYGNFDIEVIERAAAAVDSYNNYIEVYKIAKEEFPVNCVFIGDRNEKAVYSVKGECFFRDENGETVQLKGDKPYSNIYKLDDDIIVCQQFGNTAPCDVYIMTDGKPVLDEKISGGGMLLSRSSLYNDRFELIESVYDASTGGGHTFKRYQFYRDKDSFHEYGSITVPMEEFNKYYGEAAQKVLNEFQTEEEISGLEISEVLYRDDHCFILNCRQQTEPATKDEMLEGAACNYYNLTLKLAKEGFSFVNWDRGIYKTALIPEIAVYPDEMCVPQNDE